MIAVGYDMMMGACCFPLVIAIRYDMTMGEYCFLLGTAVGVVDITMGKS